MPTPQLIVAGTLNRHAATASACAAAAGWAELPVSVDAGFDEYDHYELFAQTHAHLTDPAALSERLRASEHPQREFLALFERAFGGWVRGDTQSRSGLTWTTFRERCIAALERVSAACASGQRAIVVTSGGPITAICQALLGLPDERVHLIHTRLFNASLTHVLTRGKEMALSTFNSVAHLESDPARHGLVTYL
jgi:broad specificity phosphatase PhoE